jgi:NADH-quinone oxidoreductase subunit G
MATIFIDQHPFTVNPQQNLLEAALAKGLDLPYFCWHPSLGSVGSCRQCAVQQFQDENDTQGRMVMACMTPLKDGARFSIKHPSCTDFRKLVIEWMMVNHPHDCPVCDEGGECHLQDMTLMTGHNSRRFRFNKRTFNNQDLGPFIKHEMNRCITCYRCVRFYKDVAGGTDLSAFANSGRVYFGRDTDGKLESNFSGNLAEVCPTGVFTDKIFHEHHTRKWDLETAPSICQQCSVGCNISPGARTGQLRRVQNRYHHEINGYFICDQGRFGHHFVNSPERLKTARVFGAETSVTKANEQILKLLTSSAKIIGIGSAQSSLEANFMLKTWVGQENFYDPCCESYAATEEALKCLAKAGASIATQKDIREADAILVLGEDLHHTAPITALAIRQAAQLFAQAKAQNEQGISPWNDTAVRDYVRGQPLPIFVAHDEATELDNLASVCRGPRADLQALVVGLNNALAGQTPEDPSNKQLQWAREAASALMRAKKPVIIVGTEHSSANLIHAVGELFSTLAAKIPGAKLSIVATHVNRVGLAELKPKSLAALTADADVAIVLPNAVANNSTLQKCLERAKLVVVIDYLNSPLTELAQVVLPCLSFVESTGSVVNLEGRLQRYFSVYKNSWPGVESPWRMMKPFVKKSHQFADNDELCRAMAEELGWPPQVFEELYGHKFNIDGLGIARQTSEYSGRTALNANVTMDEPTPPLDPDSPLVYSMEGARRKIPLPLLASAWEPKWNSVQASFQDTLNIRNDPHHRASGVRLFERIHKNRAEGQI